MLLQLCNFVCMYSVDMKTLFVSVTKTAHMCQRFSVFVCLCDIL